MSKHWAFWMVVGGLGLDLIDAFTTKAGTTGGALYGATGPLASINAKLPGKFNTGEFIAIIGAAILFFEGGVQG